MSNLVKDMLKKSVEALGGNDAEVAPKLDPALDVLRLTRAFVRMREVRLALKSEFEEKDRSLRGKQAIIQAAMLKFLNTHGLDSAPTEAGTFYKQEEITPTGSDWDVFYKWITENDAFDALERRIKKKFISDYMEEHQGSVPPGVSVFREYVVRVRRK